jgi:hypothetical protein
VTVTVPKPDYAGLRRWVDTQPLNGGHVGVYDGREAGLDTDGGRWQTVCEPHGGIISHATLALANEHAPHPDEWCEYCMGNAHDDPPETESTP